MNGRFLTSMVVVSLVAISLPAGATTQCPAGTRAGGDTGLMWLSGLSVVGIAAGVTGGVMATRADTTAGRVGWGVGGAVAGVGAIVAAVWLFSHYVLACRRVVMVLLPLPNVRSDPFLRTEAGWGSTSVRWALSW